MLTKLLQLNEKQLQQTIIKQLRQHKYTIHNKAGDQYIYATKKSPVLIVAHTDIVHKLPPSTIFHDRRQKVLWSPTGLGADDRAGVYAALVICQNYPCDLLFTTGEERGGTGAAAFIDDYRDNPGYSMILQLDRKGRNDAVFYTNQSKNFHDYILSFGFSLNYGTFTDISIIAPVWKVNAVNLSIGYVSEHTKQEHLYLDAMQDTIRKVSTMLSQDIPLFDYQAYTDYSDYDDDICEICGNSYDYTELIAVEDRFTNSGYIYACVDCACDEQYTFTCSTCQKNHPFERLSYSDIESYDGMICVDCISHYPTVKPNIVRLNTKKSKQKGSAKK